MRRYSDSSGSAINYDAMRRRRARWNGQGLQGYASFLLGDASLPGLEESGAIVGASEAAGIDNIGGSSAARSIAIGVATGAITFLLNRWLAKVLG